MFAAEGTFPMEVSLKDQENALYVFTQENSLLEEEEMQLEEDMKDLQNTLEELSKSLTT